MGAWPSDRPPLTHMTLAREEGERRGNVVELLSSVPVKRCSYFVHLNKRKR